MRLVVLAVLALAPSTVWSRGGESTYHFGVNESRTNISFVSKADIETIVGTTHAISGSATVDWDAGTASVKLEVPVASLRTGIDARDEHLRGENWLNEPKFPLISFTADKAAKSGDRWTLDGQFSLHGVAKALRVEAEVRRIPDELAKKVNLGPGEWIRVRAEWTVRLSDHGVQVPGAIGNKVSDSWQVAIDLFASTEKPAAAGGMAESTSAKSVQAEKFDVDWKGTKYRIGERPQLTNITAETKTDLETVLARTGTAAGVVAIDGGSGRVKLHVPVASLRTGIELRDEHLRSAAWLDAEKYPNIEFWSEKAVRKDASTWTVQGRFWMHGVARNVETEVSVKEIPAAVTQKAGWSKNPAIQLRTSFKVRLSDHGVKIPEQAALKVSDEILITVDVIAIQE